MRQKFLHWYWHGKSMPIILGFNGLVGASIVALQILSGQAIPVAIVIGSSVWSILNLCVAIFNVSGPYSE